MKKALLAVLLVHSVSCYSQVLKFNEIENYNYKNASYLDFTEYQASDGSIYKIGDLITFGTASLGRTYNYILSVVALTPPKKYHQVLMANNLKSQE